MGKVIEEAQVLIATAFSPEMAYEAFNAQMEIERPGWIHQSFVDLPEEYRNSWTAVCRSFCDQAKGQFQHVATAFYKQGREDRL
jgi:hypothetical protein